MTEAHQMEPGKLDLQPLLDAAVRALEAWDSTVLPRARDGMLQERMEGLRVALQNLELSRQAGRTGA